MEVIQNSKLHRRLDHVIWLLTAWRQHQPKQSILLCTEQLAWWATMKWDEHHVRTKHDWGEHKHGRCQAACSGGRPPAHHAVCQGTFCCNTWAVLGLSMPCCSVLSVIKMYLLFESSFERKIQSTSLPPPWWCTFWMSWLKIKVSRPSWRSPLPSPYSVPALFSQLLAMGWCLRQAGGWQAA